MNDDNRLLYDIDDEEYENMSEEYENMSEEERAEISERTMEDALEMMFPDGRDED